MPFTAASRLRKRLAGAVACLCLSLVACDQGPSPDRLRQGQAFPTLVLTDFSGHRVPLDDYRGRVVVLNVWATWCAPCRKELPGLERLHRQLDPSRFAVLGLSVDSDLHVAREFLAQLGISFTNFSDPQRRIASQLLGIRVYPDTFILSRNGILLRKVSGERDWDTPDVVRALQAAYNGRTETLDEIQASR